MCKKICQTIGTIVIMLPLTILFFILIVMIGILSTLISVFIMCPIECVICRNIKLTEEFIQYCWIKMPDILGHTLQQIFDKIWEIKRVEKDGILV
jgi:uncharacterized metal-binding protein